MSKQRFLAGDTFRYNGKRYYYHRQSNTVMQHMLLTSYQPYAQMEVATDSYAKLVGKFFTMHVAFALEFKDLNFIQP
jgi:hypothetical protein